MKHLRLKTIMALCLSMILIMGNATCVMAQQQSFEKTEITISNVKEFNAFANNVNNGNTYAGKIIRLVEDIDFTGTSFKRMTKEFAGIFDGGGYSLNGISLVESYNAAIFDTITGTVRNVVVRDSEITSTATNKYIYVATIANNNRGVIENCISYATVLSSNDSAQNDIFIYVAGIASNNYGVIINCGNMGSITIAKKGGNIGGIAAYNEGEIINCYNQGKITSKLTSGGIVGGNGGGSAAIINCYNTGTATSGIVVGAGTGNVVSCYYLEDASEVGSENGTFSASNVKAMSQSEMSSTSFVNTLNAGVKNNAGSREWVAGALYPEHVKYYEITFEKDYTAGTIASSDSYAAKGNKVTLKTKPGDKYYTKALTVNTAEGISVAVSGSGNSYSFIMPGDNVVVSAVFAKLAIPTGVKFTKSDKTLKWSNVEDATGYEVYRSTSASKGFALIKNISNATTLKYTDSKANGGTTYYYKVRAYIEVKGEKIYSSLSTAVK